MKVFRKHNATSLHDAFLKKVSVNRADLYYLTWTAIKGDATVFESNIDAQSAIDEWSKDCSNNYSFTYKIISEISELTFNQRLEVAGVKTIRNDNQKVMLECNGFVIPRPMVHDIERICFNDFGIVI